MRDRDARAGWGWRRDESRLYGLCFDGCRNKSPHPTATRPFKPVMSELYQNRYRVPAARAQWWDYRNNAAYFVTICTQNRAHFFGRIDASETRLIASLPGAIAQVCWLEIPEHFPFVRLDAFVVMPNHVHGILVIDKMGADAVETRFIASPPPPIIAFPPAPAWRPPTRPACVPPAGPG